MAIHQHGPNANTEWLYFQSVIAWVMATFPRYRKEMKAVEWGPLYNTLKDVPQDSAKLEVEVTKLMLDPDVSSRKGIYTFVLTGDERPLSIRAFTDADKRLAYERQQGVCPVCGKTVELAEMHADHITPWRLGGRTIAENCQLLCADDNRRKGGV